jgi:protein-disulfide isomerase
MQLSQRLRSRLGLVCILLLSLGLIYFVSDIQSENQSLKRKLAAAESAIQRYSAASAGADLSSSETPTIPFLQTSDHLLGPATAPVVLIEYSDLECPFCKQFHTIVQELKKEYGDKLVVAWRQFPLPSHANAKMEAEVSECVALAQDNAAFWQFVDATFAATSSTGTSISREQAIQLGVSVGSNQTTLETCVTNDQTVPRVLREIQEGQAAGLRGTPSVFIMNRDGAHVQGTVGVLTLEEYRTMINTALQ